jgi:hypothetical protein
MTPKFLDLSGRLQPYEDLFREIIRGTNDLDISFFVVGAFARDVLLNVAHGVPVKLVRWRKRQLIGTGNLLRVT